MKLTRKLSLWIGLGVCLVLGVNAWLRVRSDVSVYRRDVMRDHDVMGRGLATAVELLWRTDGETRAREVVAELDLRTANTQIRWVWPGIDAGADEAPRRPDLVPSAGEGTRSRVIEGAEGPRILSYTLVDLPGERLGAIEMDEQLADEHAYVRQALLRSAATTTVLIVLCVALTLGFGMVFVARPLRVLARKAERIGQGDLEGPVAIAQDDEIRDVGRAMNAMCERLGEARDRLDRETAAKVRALEQLRHADRLRTVGQLASMIAHELGTPLNVVRARGSMIAEGGVSSDRMRELGVVVIEQSDRMAGIIRGLLDVARRDPPDRYRTDLVHPVRQAVRWLEPVARERGVEIVLVAPDGARAELPARIDPRQIQQALTNLIVNAVHASSRGNSVEVRVSGTDDGALVEIVDHGAGIAPEDRAKVFEPFFTTKDVGEGTGLGLSVAEDIVREHGGTIEVDASPGGGATFRVRLPRDAAGDVAADPSQDATMSRGARPAERSAARESWRRDHAEGTVRGPETTARGGRTPERD